jgi:elongator complex protein 3
MPNLPGSTPEKDREMMIHNFLGFKSVKRDEYVLQNPDIQVDQLKIYPTAVTAYTEIEEWYLKGEYKPYSAEKLVDILVEFKSRVFPWIRINRVVRDFFAEAIHENAGRDLLNLRDELSKYETNCRCIRCREVKNASHANEWIIDVLKYNASNGDEYFIQAVSKCKNTLYGFVRLRLDDGFNKAFMELNNAALIREVHVYSQTTYVGSKDSSSVQHRGIGTSLMKRAIDIAKKKGYHKMAVISGIGAQTFYEKLGFERSPSDFMIKRI